MAYGQMFTLQDGLPRCTSGGTNPLARSSHKTISLETHLASPRKVAHMSQPTPHPHHVSQLFGPALDGIIHALADRGDQTDAEYDARAEEARTLVHSFQPRDTVDLMLTGQFITLNELFADTSRDILCGMQDALKQRARSTAIAMCRLALAQVGEFDRRGMRPHRTEASPEQRPARAARTSEPAEQLQAAAPAPLPEVGPQPPTSEAAPPGEEASWVDEPYQEWLEETPAMRAATTAAASSNPAPLLITHDGNANAGALPELGLPPQHPEQAHAEAVEAAA
jgi:hypothetical protein